MEAWSVGVSWNQLAAMLLKVIAFLAVLYFMLDPAGGEFDARDIGRLDLELVSPMFSIQSAISVALLLYLVKMARHNIPSFAVLELNSYEVKRPFLMRSTGLISLLIDPFGAIPVNTSAITASMMAGEDAGRDPAGRYWAAVVSGLAYAALAFAASYVSSLAIIAPPELITTVAGLALIPAFVASAMAAFSQVDQIDAPALTFLIARSVLSLLGVSGAVWGPLVGSVIWILKS